MQDTINSNIKGDPPESTLRFFAKEQVRAFDEYLTKGDGRNRIREVMGK